MHTFRSVYPDPKHCDPAGCWAALDRPGCVGTANMFAETMIQPTGRII